MARGVGHGMTRKARKGKTGGLARGGLTRRREGHEGFLGMARGVGHGVTRKARKGEGEGEGEIGARGVNTKTRRTRRFFGDGARRGPRNDTEIHGKGRQEDWRAGG
jgi:hypothetical protein